MAFLEQFGSVPMMLLAFVIALSVIVAVHEYGHYIVGRWSGIKAEVFSIGFGPVLFSRTDRHGTRWQIAALPFGGYVKFLGDSNAASAKDGAAMGEMAEMSPEMLRQTMHGAPLWARTATVTAGPVFNFILSILIFAGVGIYNGKAAEPLAIGELRPLPVEGVTLQPGDELISIAGTALPPPDSEDDEAFGKFVDALPVAALLDYEVRRNGRVVTAAGPFPMPPLVTQVAPQSAAYAIDMRPGDVITHLNGMPINAFDQLKQVIEGSDGQAVELKVWRAGEVLDFVLAPRRVDEPQPEGGFRTQWRIGIAGGMAFEPATEPLGLGTAIWRGVEQTGRVIDTSISGIYYLIAGKISTCNMTGPIGIAQVSGAMASQGTESFIWFIAFLSAAIGLLNLFPIPVLDGGHLVFYAYEAVAGKPPSDGALRILMTVGLVLILGLMLFALGNDIVCP